MYKTETKSLINGQWTALDIQQCGFFPGVGRHGSGLPFIFILSFKILLVDDATDIVEVMKTPAVQNLELSVPYMLLI